MSEEAAIEFHGLLACVDRAHHAQSNRPYVRMLSERWTATAAPCDDVLVVARAFQASANATGRSAEGLALRSGAASLSDAVQKFRRPNEDLSL